MLVKLEKNDRNGFRSKLVEYFDCFICMFFIFLYVFWSIPSNGVVVKYII